MAYSINRTSSPASGITVADGSVNNTFDIAFIGKGYTNYGEIIQENMLHIMENFARATPPTNPTPGQLWFNTNTSVLFVRTEGSPGTWLSLLDPVVGSIDETHIKATAQIELSKIAAGVAGNIIIANTSGVPTYRSMSGAISMDNTGVTTLAPNAVGPSHVQNGVIQSNHLSASIHISTLTASNITLAANSIGSAHLQAGSVGASEISTNAVGSSELANNAVAAGHIQTDAVGSSEIQNAAVLSSHLSASIFANKFDTKDLSASVITVNTPSGDAMIFDAGDSRITIHDGFGNFSIKSGADKNDLYVNTGNGAVKTVNSYEGTNGVHTINAAPVGTLGSAINWESMSFNYLGVLDVPTIDVDNITVNGTANIGTLNADTANLGVLNASTLNAAGPVTAQYADLAEKYESDGSVKANSEGMVVIFGGDKAAFRMNDKLQTETWPAIALQGRVPVNVIGTVTKGAMLVSSHIAGYAMAFKGGAGEQPLIGSVIGKALEEKTTEEQGQIVAVVGRV